MKELITMLAMVPATTDALKIAKGKYYLATSWSEMCRINKQLTGNGG